MKRTIRLSESELTNLIKRIVNENMMENDLYQNINDVLDNSIASENEKIQVLRHILNQKEGVGFVTKNKVRRHWGLNEAEEQFVLIDVEETDPEIANMCVDATEADFTAAGVSMSDRKKKHRKCNAGKIKRDRSKPVKKIKTSGRPWP